MWISHHFPEDYDRCVVIGRSHVCRRCLVIYPIAFVVMAVLLATGAAAGPTMRILLVVLPLPAVVEFVLEHLGACSYSPARQVTVSVGLGLGLGVGFATYLRHPSDLWFWGVVVLYTAVCLASVLIGAKRR